MKKILFLIILTTLSTFSGAQNVTRTYESATINDGQLIVKVSDGTIKIQPITTEAFSVQFWPSGSISIQPSHAVVATPVDVKTTLEDHNKHVHFNSEGLSVTVTKAPFQISYSYRGRTLVSEQTGYFDHESGLGFEFNLTEDEVLYGAGERALGMNRRGYKLPLYNKPAYGFGEHAEQMYYSIPAVISSNQYMILWDNVHKGSVDLGKTKTNTLRFESDGGRTAYVIIAGDGFKAIAENFTQLTGTQPLPPRWVLGNYASRFGYHSEREVKNVVSKFQKDSIPLDGLILDIFWFGKDIKGTMGTLDWLTDSFPNGPAMMKELKTQGVKTVLISEPFILTTSARWQEAVDADILCKKQDGKPYVYEFYFGETGLIDIFKPEAQEWIWNIYKDQKDQGVSGWWCDLGEPEVHPSDLLHVNGKADDVHAIYGHYWAKTIFDGMAQDFPNERPVILMRSGYAGTQRFGVVTWSGDVSRDWPGLRSQPEIALQMGMQGIGYHHSDLGGFAGGKKDAELYTRWLQYGVFQPIFRPHAQEEVPSEPIFWDTLTKARTKKAIELRYKMLPYNYTLAHENTVNGTPLMRPLLFEEPTNSNLFEYDKAYLWGDAFLVAPVVDSGRKTMEVYFPSGSSWVNFYNDQSESGGQTKTVELNLEHIPTYVRAGAIVPMTANPITNTDQYRANALEIHIYPAENGKATGTLYDDDGSSKNSIEGDQFEAFTFNFTTTDGGAEIKVLKTGKGFSSAAKNRAMTFVIHAQSFKLSKAVSQGQSLKIEPIKGTKTVQIQTVMSASELSVKMSQ